MSATSKARSEARKQRRSAIGEKYLLYIDLLGFSDLVSRQDRKVEMIYGILDSLNVHRHNVFKTIVFSDTVLVYNDLRPKDAEGHEYLVWYLVEFAEDLHHRSTGLDIFFRAILTYGEFHHTKLENLDAFYGAALVSAYNSEKSIPSIGLFIDDKPNHYNRYFRTEPFGAGRHFVYLNRDIERLYQETQGDFPLMSLPSPYHFEESYPYIAWQVRFLSDVYTNMRQQPDAHVRAKFLTAWDFYHRRYPLLLDYLVEHQFDLQSLSPSYDFRAQRRKMEESMDTFPRMGLPKMPMPPKRKRPD